MNNNLSISTQKHFRGRISLTMLVMILPFVLVPLFLGGIFAALYAKGSLPSLTLAIILFGFSLLLVVTLLGYVLFRVFKPLSELNSIVRLFLEGNWEQRAPAKRKDEIGLLAFNFNQLADEMTMMYRLVEALKTKRSMKTEPLGINKASDPKNYNPIFQLGFQIIFSDNLDQVLARFSRTLQEIPYASALLRSEGNELNLIHHSPGSGKVSTETLTNQQIPMDMAVSAFKSSDPITINNLHSTLLPQPLLDLPIKMGCQTAAYLPIFGEDESKSQFLYLLLILGANESMEKEIPLNQDSLQPYTALVELVSNALWKLDAQQSTKRRLEELELLTSISQTVAAETDLTSLFQAIHQQILQFMGELSSFAITLYDQDTSTIRIPYMYEEGQMINIPPIPLGEGLTSIVIRTRRPLLLVEDTEEKSRALGAKVFGQMAKSWLGVPMLFGGEPIGTIIVQDLKQEKRFTEEDQRLLTTMASQLAIVVRNARLLEASRRQARFEQLLNEITAKIGRSVDIPSILRTTAEELSVAVGAHHAHVELKVDHQ